MDLGRLGLNIHDAISSGSAPAGEKRAANAAATTSRDTNGTAADAPAPTV